MRFRKLRIAWSVFWGLACVLLIVLWVRSYTYEEDIGGRFTRIAFRVVSGRARFIAQCALASPSDGGLSFQVNSELNRKVDVYDAELSEISNKLGFGFFRDPSPCVIFPHWFASLVAIAFAAMPWIRWTNRFSLRTLLLAMTLVAVVLGLIIWLGS